VSDGRGALGTLVELVATIAIAVGAAFLIQAFVIKPYKVPTGSMLPTIQLHQRVLAYRLDTHPHLGDIVVFHPPAGANANPPICANHTQGTGHGQACDHPTARESSQTFIKRVVGMPGDRISIRDGQVIRNGVREHAGYALPCSDGGFGCNFDATITVPRGDYYMMGDNRGDSDDSRFWGPVPQRWIIGLAVFTYWPLDRIGTL
jgi:signal peptidase I